MQEGLLLRVWVSKSIPSQEPLVSSTLPDVVDATRTALSADAGTPAGTVVLRAAGLRVRGGTVTAAGDAAPAAGELAVFCRPVVTAPAVVRRDGTGLADAWLPDLVRLGELDRHLGGGAGAVTGGGEAAAVVLAGMADGAADGMLVNLADTPARRAMFGSTGTEDGSSPLPQLRIVAVTARAGRAMPGAILGSSHAGEQ